MLKIIKKIILLILTMALLVGCSNTEKPVKSKLIIPPYLNDAVQTKSRVHTVPLGYYSITINTEAEISGSIFVGTDSTIIPTGTFLYIFGLGFRVATSDSKAMGKVIVIYDQTDKKKLFIWSIVKTLSDEKSLRIIEI